MRALIFVVMMLASNAAYAASYAKPLGAPSVFVPDHGVEVGVWAAQTAIGHGIGVFEKSGTGAWTLCGMCMIDPEIPSLDNAVSGAGGVGPYVESKRDRINAVLAGRYPAVMPPSTGSTLDKVNASLAGQALRLVNGVPTLAGK